VTRKLQITGGLRHFSQWFTDAQSYVDYTFPTDIPATPHRSTAGKFIGKADVSYEYSPSHFIYALWSQGFRRGGATRFRSPGRFRKAPVWRPIRPTRPTTSKAVSRAISPMA
jgi:outer membrane receptor protein involved in Fe transport